jgi:hypothetical protein
MNRSMSPESKALVDYLRKHGGASVDTLTTVVPADSRTGLRKRLGNLERGGWLQKEQEQETVLWSIRPSARELFAKAELPRPATKKPPFVGVPALPRRINVMTTPPYCPSQDLVARQGAFDFMRVPSHGVRC